MNILAEIIEEIKRDVAGAVFLRDWLGDDGKIVEQHHADSRSAICRTIDEGRPCRFNVSPNWWDEHFKDPIAHAMRRELELKNKMKLKAEGEENLHVCKICGCALPLKVFATKDQLAYHTPPKTLDKFPVWCWIKTELL